MKEPLFSVIVPTHGRPDLLREAIVSVLQQSMQDLECIVVDDAGPGRLENGTDPRVRVIRRDRRGGAAAARNTGLTAARGRYVTFLDDDDVYTPDRLTIALEGLAEAPIALCLRGSKGLRSEKVEHGAGWDGDLTDRILLRPVPNVGQAAMDRDLVPCFDERFLVSEDVEWWVRAARVGEVATVPRVGYLLRQHRGMRQTGRLADRLDCRLLLLETHADYFASNRKAASYQWRRVGGLAGALGARRIQRDAFKRSLALDPGIRGLVHLANSYRPSLGHADQPPIKERVCDP